MQIQLIRHATWGFDMKLTSLIMTGLIVAVLTMGSLVWWFWQYAHPHPSFHPREFVDINGPGFKIRISEFPEEPGILPGPLGSYYRFESFPNNRSDSVIVTQIRVDDFAPLPRQNIRFLGPRAAYIFMFRKYAVTTDGGRQWIVWSTDKDLNWPCCQYPVIRKVEVSESGAGKMVLHGISQDNELVTSDFGQHWSPAKAN